MASKRIIQAAIDGEPVQPEPEEVDELDKSEVQLKINNPEVAKLVLTDGEEIELRTELTLKDRFRTTFLNDLHVFRSLIIIEASKISGTSDATFDDIRPYAVLAVFQHNVQASMNRLLAQLSNRTPKAFDGMMDKDAIMIAYTLLLNMLTKEQERIDSHSGNGKKNGIVLDKDLD